MEIATTRAQTSLSSKCSRTSIRSWTTHTMQVNRQSNFIAICHRISNLECLNNFLR